MKKSQIVVAKFGGSSLADTGQFRKVKGILDADPARRYVVPSAPGKRGSADEKVTDLLYRCCEKAGAGEDYAADLMKIRMRYQEIAAGLGLEISLEKEFAVMEQALADGAGAQYAASRGEYLNGILLAAYLGFEFVDAA